MAGMPYTRTSLSPRLYPSFFRFTLFFSLFTPSLFLFILPTLVIRIDRRGYSHRPTRILASTDADTRIDRCGCSYRPTQTLVSTDADDFCWCFAVSNLYFRAAKPLLSCCQTVAFVVQNLPFTFYTLFFLQYLPLFSSISSAFLLCASSGCSP